MAAGARRTPDVRAWRIGAAIACGLIVVLVVLDRIDHRPNYAQLVVARTHADTAAGRARQDADIRRVVSALPAMPGVRAVVAAGPNTDDGDTTVEIRAQGDDVQALMQFHDRIAAAARAGELVSSRGAVRIYHVHDLLLIPLYVGMLLSVSTLQTGARNGADSPAFSGGAIVVHLIALGLAAAAFALYAPNDSARVPMGAFAAFIVAAELLWAFQLPDVSDHRGARALRRPQLVAIACFALLALVRVVQPASG